MEVSIRLRLPRDSGSVPIARKVLAAALGVLGVTRRRRDDVELALTEACANAIKHAGAGEQYAVSAGLHEGNCVIEVKDFGSGFDETLLAPDRAVPLTAEHGRGLQIIASLADNIWLSHPPPDGSVVHFEIPLEWERDAPIRQLSAASTGIRSEPVDGRPGRSAGPGSPTGAGPG